MIVSEVEFENRIISLCPKGYVSDENIYTIIVGRNGSGKSRLFQKIILLAISSLVSQTKHHWGMEDLLDYAEGQETTGLDERGSLTLSDGKVVHKVIVEKSTAHSKSIAENNPFVLIRGGCIKDQQTQNTVHTSLMIQHMTDGIPQERISNFPIIIAVSSSPFDKFPLLDDRRIRSNLSTLSSRYIYRGARTKDKSGKGYMRSKFDQVGTSFVNLFLRPHIGSSNIQALFSYLNVEPKITVLLKISSLHTKSIKNDPSLSNNDKEIILKSYQKIYDGLHRESESDDEFRQLRTFDIELDFATLSNIKPNFIEEFSTLADYNLVDLLNIKFTKLHEDRQFFLTDASSGELCIIFNISAIASTISDNSIVLLDEPELSLHPQWQEDFLPLIKTVFSGYKNCHFIVATHSPSIVSSIPPLHSFVVNLENNPAIPVKGYDYAFKSADYQLAETFNSPGYRNEYLISELVEVLSKLSEGEILDIKLTNRISGLIEFDDLINEGDPVKKLISTLKKAMEVLLRE